MWRLTPLRKPPSSGGGGEEGPLGSVFRRLRGGQHAQAEVVDTTLVRLDEDVEGRQVALFAAGHQQRLIRRPVLQSHPHLIRIVAVMPELVRVILSERANLEGGPGRQRAGKADATPPLAVR